MRGQLKLEIFDMLSIPIVPTYLLRAIAFAAVYFDKLPTDSLIRLTNRAALFIFYLSNWFAPYYLLTWMVVRQISLVK